jgi:hypothetical protein
VRDGCCCFEQESPADANAPERLFFLWKMFLARRMPCRKNFAILQSEKWHFPLDLQGILAGRTYLLPANRTTI